MLKKLKTAPTAAAAVFLTTLMCAVPALAGSTPASSPDSIITPGFGTLGAIFEWLLLLLI